MKNKRNQRHLLSDKLHLRREVKAGDKIRPMEPGMPRRGVCVFTDSHGNLLYKGNIISAILVSLFAATLLGVVIYLSIFLNHNTYISVSLSDYSGKGGENEKINSRIDEIFGNFEDIFPTNDDPEQLLDRLSAGELLDVIFSNTALGDIPKFFAMIMGICLIFTLTESKIFGDKLRDSMNRGAAVIMSIPVAGVIYSLISSSAESIRLGCEFFSGLIPIVTTVTALLGGTATAAQEAAGMSLALGFVSGVLLENLVPLISLVLALALLGSLDSGGVLGGITGSIKNIFTIVFGLVGMLLPAILALKTVISTAADSMTLRGLKYAVGNLVPVVGGSVSGMLGSLMSGVGILSGKIGALSVAAVLIIFASPLICLLLYRLCFSLCMSFMDFVGAKGGRRVLSSTMSALDLLIGIMCMSGVIFLLEVVICMKSVSGLA